MEFRWSAPRCASWSYDGDFAGLADGPAPLTVRLAPVPGWRRIPAFDRAAGLARIRAVSSSTSARPARRWRPSRGVSTALEAGDARGALLSLGGDLATAGHPPEGGWRSSGRGQLGAAGFGWRRRHARARRHGDVQHDRPALAHLRRRTAPSRHRPAHGAAGRRAVAHRDRRRTHVCPRECRSDGRDRDGRDRDPWLEATGLPARLIGDGRAYPRARWLAGWCAGRGLITRRTDR